MLRADVEPDPDFRALAGLARRGAGVHQAAVLHRAAGSSRPSELLLAASILGSQADGLGMIRRGCSSQCCGENEPRFLPVALDGAFGDAQRFGNFPVAVAAKVAHLRYLRQSWISLLQKLQRLVH